MLTRKEHVKIVIFSIILVIVILLQYFLSDRIAFMTKPIVNWIQKDEYLLWIMGYYTTIGSKFVKKLLIAITFSLCNYYHAFLYVGVTYTSIFANNYLKILLQEPRPFWVDSSITVLECESGYGYPSDHVLTTVPSFLIFFEIMYYRFEIDKTVNANIFYWVGIAITNLLCISIGFSRLSLGVHSLDQVVFGLLLGFAFYFFYLYVVDYDLRDYRPFLQMISNKYHIQKTIFIILAIYLIFMVNMYFIHITYKGEWMEVVKTVCTTEYYSPFILAVIYSGEYFLLLGSFIGLLYDVKYNYSNFTHQAIPPNYIFMNIMDHNNKIRIGKWNDTNTFKGILRTLLTLVQIHVMFSTCDYISHLKDNHLLAFVFTRTLPAFLTGFIIFGLVKKQSCYLGIANEEVIDIDREKLEQDKAKVRELIDK